jgi:hypothetical protein
MHRIKAFSQSQSPLLLPPPLLLLQFQLHLDLDPFLWKKLKWPHDKSMRLLRLLRVQ